MSVRIHCPFCDQKYDLDDFKEGVEVECASCAQKFTLEMSLIGTTGETGGADVGKTVAPVSAAPRPPQKADEKPGGEERKPDAQPSKEKTSDIGGRERRRFPISTICQMGSFLALLAIVFLLLA